MAGSRFCTAVFHLRESASSSSWVACVGRSLTRGTAPSLKLGAAWGLGCSVASLDGQLGARLRECAVCCPRRLPLGNLQLHFSALRVRILEPSLFFLPLPFLSLSPVALSPAASLYSGPRLWLPYLPLLP